MKSKVISNGKRILKKSSEKYSKSGDDSTEEMRNLLNGLDDNKQSHGSNNVQVAQPQSQETTGNRLSSLLGSVGPPPSDSQSMNSLANLAQLGGPSSLVPPSALEQGMMDPLGLGPAAPQVPQMPAMPSMPQGMPMPHAMPHMPQGMPHAMPMSHAMPQGMPMPHTMPHAMPQMGNQIAVTPF